MFQGAIGPDGPTGESGLEGKKVSPCPHLMCVCGLLFFFIKINWHWKLIIVELVCLHKLQLADFQSLGNSNYFSICRMDDIFHPSLSLQASDGPPGKMGFPGPQVRLCFSSSFLPFMSFGALCLS